MGLITRAIEKRASLANPDEFLIRAFGGAKSNSGVSVTPDSALSNTAVLAAVERLSRAVATLPLMIYRRLPDGGRERDTSHRLWSKLHDAPNNEHTALEFRQFQMASLLLRGNSYSYKEYNNAGELSLWPLRADQIATERIKGHVVHNWTPSTGKPQPFLGTKIHHLRGLSKNGLTGLSPIQLAQESVGLGLAAEEFGARFFSGGANAGSVLKHPKELSDPARKRLKDSFDQAASGLSGSHKAILLEEGLDWTKMSVDPRDAQFIELRKFQVRDGARIFGVQPHMIGDLEDATFTNIESQGIEFVVYTLAYWLTMFEQAIHRDLFTEAERKTHFVEFLVEGLLRGDVAARGEFYTKLFNMGSMNRNEIRARENLNPVPGGDTFFVPMNLAALDENGIPIIRPDAGDVARRQTRDIQPPERRAADGSTTRKALREGFAGLFSEATRRVLKSERQLVMKEARRQLTQRSAEEFSTWLDGFYDDHEKFVNQRVAPVYRALAESVEPSASLEAGVDSTRGEAFDEFVSDLSTAHAARHTRSSRGQLRKVIEDNPEDPIAALDERFDLWEETRADRVGKRSSVQGGEAVARFVFAAAGVGMVWHTSGESCPLCNELDGRQVSGATPFLADGETLNADGVTPLRTSSAILHPSLHDGCDCWISPG